MLKIVHINTTDNRGGAAQIAYLLHSSLNKIPGVQSRMLVREKNTADPTVSSYGITGLLRLLSILFAHDHTFSGGEKLLNHPWIKDADIIHLHNVHGYYFHLPILRKLTQTKKIIWTLHDMWTMTGHCGTSFLSEPNTDGFYRCNGQFEYVPILLPRSRALCESKRSILSDLSIIYLAPSLCLRDKFKKSHLKNHQCLHLPYGLNTELFFNQKDLMDRTREELGLPQNKKIILFIANNFSDPVKGRKTIEKLLNDPRLNHVRFVAIGNGKLPEHSHLSVLPYTKDKTKLAHYYAAADVYIHPALMDNFPLVVIESLLSGTPVVAYDVGGLKELVRDGTDGRIIKGGNYGMFLEAIIHTLEKIPESTAISGRAKEEFSTEKMVQRHMDIYKIK